jgi:hypothetical protein
MKKSLLIFLGPLVFSQSLFALETDQFITFDKELKDSSPYINNYFHEKMQLAVDEANNKSDAKSCEKVASDVFTLVLGRLSISKISKFAENSNLIERFPEDSISNRDYFDISIYKDAPFYMKIAALSRTINLGGVYMGTDKLGHFSLLGRNYYNKYLSFKGLGLSHDGAFKEAIVHGMRSETGILGYAIGGVLSLGDLESNYQGLKFAIDMCQGEKPYLVKVNDKWEVSKENIFDVKKYFSPRMDESYNISYWRPSLFKKIKGTLKAEYCTMIKSPIYLERLKSYNANFKSLLIENLNDQLINEHIFSKARYTKFKEDLNSLCNE